MPSSTSILVRAQIEAALAGRIPSALTPQPHILRPVAATTVPEIDALLGGGLPIGAISEIVGPESSGRTSLALAFAAAITQAGRVCAWVDVSNALHPESAAAIGVDLARMLWVRCGERFPCGGRSVSRDKPWRRLDQALRVTDLLLEGGGFSSIVLDMGSIAPEHALRVPLATWFRFRAAAERTQLNFLLLTQHACTKNSAGLVLRLDQGHPLTTESTLFAGLDHRAILEQRRFSSTSDAGASDHVVPLRKPPQPVAAQWRSRTAWIGRA